MKEKGLITEESELKEKSGKLVSIGAVIAGVFLIGFIIFLLNLVDSVNFVSVIVCAVPSVLLGYIVYFQYTIISSLLVVISKMSETLKEINSKMPIK